MELKFKKKWDISKAPKGVLGNIKPLSTRINKQGFWFAEYRGADLSHTPFRVQSKVAVIRATQESITLYECE